MKLRHPTPIRPASISSPARRIGRPFVVGALLMAACLGETQGKDEMNLRFTPDGSAILENNLVALTVNNRTGRTDGIRGWQFKPSGYEMVDVLFRALDAGGGHVLGLQWDAATVGDYPARTPDAGALFVPLAAGVSKDGRAIVLEQVSQGKHRLTRTLILRRDFAGVEVRLRLENLEAEPGAFALRLHNVFSAGARGQYQTTEDCVLMPGREGVLKWEQDLPADEYLARHYGVAIREGIINEAGTMWRDRAKDEKIPRMEGRWIMQLNPKNGDGMALFAEDKDLVGVYNAPKVTLEPLLKSQALRPGESWETRLFLTSFNVSPGNLPADANPLFVSVAPVMAQNGRLTGRIAPAFEGKLRVVDKAHPQKALAEYDAQPLKLLTLDVQAPSEWILVALDRQGEEIGRVDSVGAITFFEPEIHREEKVRPQVKETVSQDPQAEEAIRAAIQARDFVIQCDWNESEPLRELARKMARQLGVGMAWTPQYTGKMVALGSPDRSVTVRNAGLLKQSVDAQWPGAGRGAILSYDNFESTAKPLILVAGSDSAGALAAARQFHDRYVKEVPTASGFDFWTAPVSEGLMDWSRPNTTQTEKKIAISSARGEYDSAQMGLTAYEDLSEIEVTLDPLVHAETGEEIAMRYPTPARRREGPLQVRWAENFPLHAADGWPGRPDALLARTPARIPAGKTQVLWLTTCVADDAMPGLYRSAIHVKANGQTRSIPIELTVRDFTLPLMGLRNEGYMAMPLMSPSRRLRSVDLQRLLPMLTEHRFTIIFVHEPGMIRWHISPEGKYKGIHTDFLMSNEDGTLLMDTSRFDWITEASDRFAAPFDLEFNVYALDILDWPEGIAAFHRALPDRFAGKPERAGHAQQSYWAQEMFEMFRKHLERRGIFDRVTVKIGDEPPSFDSWWNEHAQAALGAGLHFNTAFNAIDWNQAQKAMGTTFGRFKPLYQQFDPEFARKAQEAGMQVGWYNCGPPPRSSTGTPASELRGYYWQAAKYNLDFVSRWGVQCWDSEGTSPENVWTFRYSHHHSLIYPEHPEYPPFNVQGKGAVDYAPLSSIRFELIRDGIEDAEYARLLRGLITRAREKGNTAEADKAEALLEDIWKRLFPTLSNFSPPYPDLMAARDSLAEAIESLQGLTSPESPTSNKK